MVDLKEHGDAGDRRSLGAGKWEGRRQALWLLRLGVGLESLKLRIDALDSSIKRLPWSSLALKNESLLLLGSPFQSALLGAILPSFRADSSQQIGDVTERRYNQTTNMYLNSLCTGFTTFTAVSSRALFSSYCSQYSPSSNAVVLFR